MGFILRAVVGSKALRQWLEPQLRTKTQTEAGNWVGLSQATINRILKQDTYDFPLDTVAKIAMAANFRRLSDFFLHLETGANPALASVPHATPPVLETTPHATEATMLRRIGMAIVALASQSDAATAADTPPRVARTRKSKSGR